MTMPRKDKIDLSSRIAKNAPADYKKMRRLLLSIVEGTLMEKVVCKKGMDTWIEDKPPSHKDRISASKLLKELQVDKSVANKKDSTESNTPADLAAAIAEYHAKKSAQIEADLEKSGKLRRIDS